MEFDYTVFQLQQSIDAELKVYSKVPQENEGDLIVIHKYQREEEELEQDLIALAEHFPEIKSALTNGSPAEVSINLQDLNAICPRHRVRTDSYGRLVKLLRTKNIKLTIKSRKGNENK